MAALHSFTFQLAARMRARVASAVTRAIASLAEVTTTPLVSSAGLT